MLITTAISAFAAASVSAGVVVYAYFKGKAAGRKDGHYDGYNKGYTDASCHAMQNRSALDILPLFLMTMPYAFTRPNEYKQQTPSDSCNLESLKSLIKEFQKPEKGEEEEVSGSNNG